MRQEQAIARARTVTGTIESVPAQSYSVRRLDRANEFYYLIVFGEPEATVAVASVNSITGDVENWARSSGLRSHLSIGATDAKRLSRMSDDATVELVWKPCVESRSPLYPLWEVRTPDGTRFVDQQGNVL